MDSTDLKQPLKFNPLCGCIAVFFSFTCIYGLPFWNIFLLLPHGCGEKRGRNASAFCLVVKACVAVCYVLCVYTLNRNSTMSPSCMT